MVEDIPQTPKKDEKMEAEVGTTVARLTEQYDQGAALAYITAEIGKTPQRREENPDLEFSDFAGFVEIERWWDSDEREPYLRNFSAEDGSFHADGSPEEVLAQAQERANEEVSHNDNVQVAEVWGRNEAGTRVLIAFASKK